LIDSVRENTPESKEVTTAEKIKRKIIPLPFLIKKTATEIKYVINFFQNSSKLFIFLRFMKI